jgi:hypothetical protein
MSNILDTTDIVNAIKTIEKDCEQDKRIGIMSEPDYKKFYNRVKGLMELVKENVVKSGSQRF